MRTTLTNHADTGPRKCPGQALIGLIAITTVMAISASALGPAQVTTRRAGIERIQNLVDRGQVDAAEKQLWEMLTREPENAAAIDLLGTIRTQQKRFPEAEALFKRVLAIAPDSVAAYRKLGQVYVLQGRRDDAKSAYLKAYELEPRDAQTILALGTIYGETGEFERSIEIINSIPANLRPSAALPVLASGYFALKQPDKVAALVPLVHRGAISEPSLIPGFARVLLENGFVDDAGELLKAASQRQKLTPEYLLVLARIQERQGDVALAERTLARVAKLYPNSFDALFHSARLASQGKEYKKEAGLLEKAVEIQPDHIEALQHLALARMRSAQAAKAVTAARHLYSLRPEDPDALYLLGAALANHAEWHDARPIVEKLVSVRDDAASRVMLGMTLMNDGDIEGAAQQFERALQKNPNEIEAHYYRGVIARQRGDLPGAMKAMEVVVGAHPQHALAQLELGTLALQTGNLNRARQALEQAVSLRPELPESHYQLGLTYSRLGLRDKAQEEMAKFRELKDTADHPKSGRATSGDAPAESKQPSKPR